MRTSHNRSQAKDELPGRFKDLVAAFPPRAIHDEADYDNTIEMLDSLTSLAERTKGQDEYLDTLAVLVEAYEDEHYPIDTSHITPLDALKYLVEQSGMNASRLGDLLGNRSLGSKLLRGERELSKMHIRALCRHFRVKAELFL